MKTKIKMLIFALLFTCLIFIGSNASYSAYYSSLQDAIKGEHFKDDFTTQNLWDLIYQCNENTKKFDINKNKENVDALFNFNAKTLLKENITYAVDGGYLGIRGLNSSCWHSQKMDLYDGNTYKVNIGCVVDIKVDGIYINGVKKEGTEGYVEDFQRNLWIYLMNYDGSQQLGYKGEGNWGSNNPSYYMLHDWLQIKLRGLYDLDKKNTSLGYFYVNPFNNEKTVTDLFEGTSVNRDDYINKEFRIIPMGVETSGAQDVLSLVVRERQDVPTGKLRIIKADSQYDTIRLEGVKFTVKSEKYGYITQKMLKSPKDSGEYTLKDKISSDMYSNNSKDAYEFTTDKEGYIDILNPRNSYSIAKRANKNYTVEKLYEGQVTVNEYDKDYLKNGEYFLDVLTDKTHLCATKGDVWEKLTGRTVAEYKKNGGKEETQPMSNEEDRYKFIRNLFNSSWVDSTRKRTKYLQKLLLCR